MLNSTVDYIDTLIAPYVGFDYAGYATFVIIIAMSFVIAMIIKFILARFVLRVSAKTKSDLDDLIIRAISLPIIISVVALGTFIALQGLPELAVYSSEINMVFTIFYILFGSLIAMRLINTLVHWYALNMAEKTHSKVDEHFLPMIKRVVKGVVLFLAFIAILGALGINLDSVVVGLGVGGIAIGLALQDTLKELFAGTQVLLDRQIKLGDFIELESLDRGTVVDIGWRSTTIRTWEGNHVTIPNSKIASSKLVNYDMPTQEFAFKVEAGVGYNEDLEKVEKVTTDVAKKVLKALGTGSDGFEPFVRFKEFGDSNINFNIMFKVKKFSDHYLVKHEVIKALKKRFEREGIEISWPVRKVYNYKGRGK